MTNPLPSSMRAAVYTSTAGGIENNLRITDVPLPKRARALPQGYVLVKTSFAALNPVDHKLAETIIKYFLPKPWVPGLDFSGLVVRSNVSHIKEGDRVFGTTIPPNFGALAEYLIAPSNAIAIVPQGVKMEDAAAIDTTGLTAYQSLVPYVKLGDHVLINGASGGIGTFAIQFAKILGVKVTAVCSGPNAELCRSLGADEVVDYRSVDIVKHFSERGIQFDHIVDAAFQNYDLYWQAHHYLKPGRIFVCVAAQLSLSFVKDFSTISLFPGWLGGGKRPFKFVKNHENPTDLKTIAGWIEDGKVKAVLSEVYEFDQVAKAFERLKTDRTRGKIIVRVS